MPYLKSAWYNKLASIATRDETPKQLFPDGLASGEGVMNHLHLDAVVFEILTMECAQFEMFPLTLIEHIRTNVLGRAVRRSLSI